ncbi:MAG: hypothetical protein ACYC8T_03375 [Myxococcaceae bacterium]
MAPRLKPSSPEPATRVRHLIAIDAAQLLKRLLARQAEMVALFSRLRSRQPMLEAIRTWFATVTFGELALLEPAEQKAVAHFYELLDELRWYLQYTEDMPGKLLQELAKLAIGLEKAHRQLVAAIGPADAEGVRVIDAEFVAHRRAPRARAR